MGGSASTTVARRMTMDAGRPADVAALSAPTSGAASPSADAVAPRADALSADEKWDIQSLLMDFYHIFDDGAVAVERCKPYLAEDVSLFLKGNARPTWKGKVEALHVFTKLLAASYPHKSHYMIANYVAHGSNSPTGLEATAEYDLLLLLVGGENAGRATFMLRLCDVLAKTNGVWNIKSQTYEDIFGLPDTVFRRA
eukprot:gnl/Hemi2/28628_TR9500_c0_g1_i1.p1 gnl/Hemi2/28628_TR9500_c0_g1~~gnl/Hemi2/28628_TR9500_c0_g1_i1.p1  ORF type:complete len:197 (-),score=26.25 gnl/Hemi2/28628_TR9500_c0_g1_i1:279-869(-)